MIVRVELRHHYEELNWPSEPELPQNGVLGRKLETSLKPFPRGRVSVSSLPVAPKTTLCTAKIVQERIKGFLWGSGISTSMKLPGVAALTASSIAGMCCRTSGHGDWPRTRIEIFRPAKFCW